MDHIQWRGMTRLAIEQKILIMSGRKKIHLYGSASFWKVKNCGLKKRKMKSLRQRKKTLKKRLRELTNIQNKTQQTSFPICLRNVNPTWRIKWKKIKRRSRSNHGSDDDDSSYY